MDNPIARNAQYLSPQIQNEIISIKAYDVLQRDLINEVKKAKFFTILADEVESHHVEQLPICVRFVDKPNDIREEFLEFGRCAQVNGESISNEILRVIKKADLDIKNCRGQGYDGASNMSSKAVIYFIYIILLGQGAYEVSADLTSKILRDMFWKTGVLELALKILEKYLGRSSF